MVESDHIARGSFGEGSPCPLQLEYCPVHAMRTALVLKVSPSPWPSVPTLCVSVTYINLSYSPDPFWLL